MSDEEEQRAARPAAAPSIRLSLLENSHSFLEEAIRRALEAETNPVEWKFAVFSLCQAVELSLKERLRREHRALVFADIDKASGVRRTVTTEQALERLRRWCDCVLTRGDIATIDLVRRWRNDVTHGEFELSPVQVKAAFGRVVSFLVDFHRAHLEESLAGVIEPAAWNGLLRIRGHSRALHERALARITAEKVDAENVLDCDQCGYSAFVVHGDTGECYVCGNHDDVVECSYCGGLVLASCTEAYPADHPSDSEYVSVCEACDEDARRDREDWYEPPFDDR